MSTVATKSAKTGKPAGLDAIFRPFTVKFSGGQISYGPAKAGGSGPPPKGGLKAPSARRTYAAVVRRERPGSGVAAPERSMPSAAPATTDENGRERAASDEGGGGVDGRHVKCANLRARETCGANSGDRGARGRGARRAAEQRFPAASARREGDERVARRPRGRRLECRRGHTTCGCVVLGLIGGRL